MHGVSKNIDVLYCRQTKETLKFIKVMDIYYLDEDELEVCLNKKIYEPILLSSRKEKTMSNLKDFFGSNATGSLDEGFQISLSTYRKLAAENGIPEEMQKKIAGFHKDVNTAAAEFLFDKAKEAGIKADDKFSMTIRTDEGTDEIRLLARRQSPNPRDRSQIVTKYGVVSVVSKRHGLFNKDTLANLAAQCEKICK